LVQLESLLKGFSFLPQHSGVRRDLFSVRRIPFKSSNKKLIIVSKSYKTWNMKHMKNFPLELIFWVMALMLLATADPHAHHFTLCPLANLGITWCPGCGLGRSISALFHGDISASFGFHWFGIPALLLIAHRIYQLSKNLIHTNLKLKYKED
jgi:hypothetical protein